MSAEITFAGLEQVSFTGLTDIEFNDVPPRFTWTSSTDIEVVLHSRTGKLELIFDAPAGSPARKLLEAMKAAVKATEEEPV
jgi:hypothetical protein